MHSPQNIFTGIKPTPGTEQFLTLFESDEVTIERIVSCSVSSPDGFWYDQDHDEWVIVLKGAARLQFSEGETVDLNAGDHLLIPIHQQHRVQSTSEETIWLAVRVKSKPVTPC